MQTPEELHSINVPARSVRPMALTHVTVLPMDSEYQLPDQTIIIEGDRIAAIGPSGTIDPAACTIVDGSGKYVLPGLADMHVHLWAPSEPALFLANGVTFVRNMSGAPFHLALQQRVQGGELPGPQIFTTGPLIEGAGWAHPRWDQLDGPDTAADLITQQVTRGYQQIKVFNRLTPAALQAVHEAAQRYGLHVVGHCPNGMSFEEASDAGMSCFEHLTGIWRGHFADGRSSPDHLYNLHLDVLQLVVQQLDWDAIHRLAHYLATHQIWNCPTLIANQRMHETSLASLANPAIQPALPYVYQRALDVWADYDPSLTFANMPYTYDTWLAAIHARNAIVARITNILAREGAPLLIGTDTSVRYVVQGFSVHEELANFVAVGLTPYAALRCATYEAARFVGQLDRWGTIAVGKRADLLVVGRNPFVDVRDLRDIAAVFVNGFYLSRADLDALLEQQAQAAALRPPGSLPPMDLPPILPEGQVVGQGVWIEQTNGRETGRVIYRHLQLADGDWVIDECYAWEQGAIFDPGGGQRRRLHVRLSPLLAIRHGSFVEESFGGTARTEITWTKTEGYGCRRVDEDGYTTLNMVSDQPLRPSVTLALTVVPLMLTAGPSATTGTTEAALAIETGRVRVVTQTWERGPSEDQLDGAVEQQWNVTMRSSRSTLRQSYRIAGDQQVREITAGEQTFSPL